MKEHHTPGPLVTIRMKDWEDIRAQLNGAKGSLGACRQREDALRAELDSKVADICNLGDNLRVVEAELAESRKEAEALRAVLSGAADGCICNGNWREIVKEYEPLFNKALYRDGKRYVFQGLVWAADDLYYLLTDSEGKAILASCVGALEKEVGHGFILSSPAAEAKEGK